MLAPRPSPCSLLAPPHQIGGVLVGYCYSVILSVLKMRNLCFSLIRPFETHFRQEIYENQKKYKMQKPYGRRGNQTCILNKRRVVTHFTTKKYRKNFFSTLVVPTNKNQM